MFKVSWLLDFLLGPKLYMGSDEPSAPEKTTTTVELPEWARGYAKDTLAKGAALTDINKNPYQQYGGERIAGFQPMQQQAFEGAAGMQPSQQVGLGSSIAGAAGLGALGTNYQGRNFQGGQFGNRQAAQYMSPFIEQAMQPQLREAERASQIQGTQQQAQAVQSGAFGGGRDAIMRAERERNLGMQQGDIRAKGYQTAYEQAANQFNQDQSRRLQAQQMGEQSRQYGAGLGMQGLQTGLQAAGQLGQLGQTEYGQKMGINQLQSQYGQQQQQQAQRPLDMAYQDFINQQNYPYKQLGFMSDMIRGLPLGQQSTSQVYQGSGSTMGQLAGIGMGAYGMSKMMAEGGEVKTYAGDYGSVTSEGNVQGIISDLSDMQLQQAKEAALNARDEQQMQMIDQEIARRAALRSNAPPQEFTGIAPALSDEFADGMEQSMATGGIVAFADRGAVVDPNELTPEDYNLPSLPSLGEIRDFFTPKAALENRQRYEKGLAEVEKAKAAPKKEAPVERAQPPVIAAPAQEVKPPPQKAAPAKPQYEDIAAGPKPSKKEVKSAVAQFAEQNNIGTEQKEDLMTTALKIREELGKQNQPILDKLNAAIEAQKPDEQALKDRGFAQALTQFGFGMAERASKPGARFLESASGAAPVIGTVAAETNKLIDTKKDNYVKLQLDQAKYEVALAKGDMQTASVLAAQIRQGQQQDKALQFQIAKAQDDLRMEQAKLASQNAYQNQMASRYETVGSLTKDIMRNEGLPYDKALEKAARMLKPTGYAADVRAGTAQNANLDKALKDIDAKQKYAFLAVMSPESPKYAGLKAEYEAEKRAAYARYGGGEETSGSPPPSLAQKGFKLLGTE